MCPREHMRNLCGIELAHFFEARSKARERSAAAAPRPAPTPDAARRVPPLASCRRLAPDDALTRPRPFRALVQVCVHWGAATFAPWSQETTSTPASFGRSALRGTR